MWRLRPGAAVAWERGEIDDATYEKRAVRFAWKVFAILFAVLAVGISAIALAKGTPLANVAAVVGFLTIMGFAIAFRMGRLARFGVRNDIIARRRKEVEANPALPLVISPAQPAELQRFFGAHRRSKRYGFWVIKMTALIAAIDAGLWWMDAAEFYVGMFATVAVGMFFWALYQFIDRRPFLDISAAGIWCRRWGTERIGFEDWKAVYPRRNGGNFGITLVPRQPEQLRRQLSLFGRLALRSGDFGGVAAHQGTLTIWINRLDLPQNELLRAVQAEIVRVRR